MTKRYVIGRAAVLLLSPSTMLAAQALLGRRQVAPSLGTAPPPRPDRPRKWIGVAIVSLLVTFGRR